MGKRTGNIRRNRPDRRYYDRREDGERRQPPALDRIRKVLVTGDRNWDDIPRVVETLRFYPPGTILVHGACQGADIICAAVAETLGFEVRPYPADWTKYKKAAGPIRNQEMLDKEHRPEEPIDVCLAFHNDIENSRGTRNMLDKADKAGIPWKLHTSHPRSSVESERWPAKPEVGGSSPPGGTVVLTEEDCKRLAEEGLALRKSLEPMLDAMHRLTPEDLHARVK